MTKGDWRELEESELRELWMLYKGRPSLSLAGRDWARLKELSEHHYEKKQRQHNKSLRHIVSGI